MSIVPPVINPVTLSAYPGLVRSVPDTQPFTSRSGGTFLQSLADIIWYLQNDLANQLDAINSADDGVLNALSSALAAQNASISAQLATTLQQIIAGENVNLNDGSVLAALELANSVSLGYLNSLYAPIAVSGVIPPEPSGSDDTAALNSWFSSHSTLKSVRFLPNNYQITGTLNIPAGMSVWARGSIFTATGGSYNAVTLASNCALIGAEITGSKSGGAGVILSGVSNTTVTDCYIHDLSGASANDGQGISVVSGSSKYKISGNRITNVHGQGISLDSSSDGIVIGNFIDTAEHGIQWWGGDGSTVTVPGINDIVITGNEVFNVQGGIWGSTGRAITVTGNHVESVSDVGIDLERTFDSTVVGNTIVNATNGGMSVFYGSMRCLFSGNTVINDASGNTSPGFKAASSTTNSNIMIVGNRFTVTGGIGISSDQSAIGDSMIDGNHISVISQGVDAIRLLDGPGSLSITNNTITVANSIGISIEGPSDSRIENNQVVTTYDSSSLSADAGGIRIYWRNATFPAKRNRVRNNVVRGFVKGIFDNCWGDVASNTLVESNICAVIGERSGTTAVFNNNRSDANHALITPTAV